MEGKTNSSTSSAPAGALDDDSIVMGGDMSALPVEEPPPAPEPAQDEQPEDEGEQAEGEAPKKKPATLPIPDATKDGPPPWAMIPRRSQNGQAFTFPRGVQVIFLRFPPEMTRTPEKGERQCILWELSDMDERVGIGRALGDPNRVPMELAKQMIRIIDGRVADWTGVAGPASVDQFWSEIGAKGRALLTRMYAQLHILTRAEQADFFERCCAVRSTA